MLLLMMIHFQ